MSLPEEVLVKISQHVVDTLSWQDVWKARLVNTTFNREITALLIKSPQLKVKGLGFKPGYAGLRTHSTPGIPSFLGVKAYAIVSVFSPPPPPLTHACRGRGSKLLSR
ncbi:hypothetical protein PEX1_064260 [Penicillium expansum]|uniref:F-box domain-containing protein n=1 Tax=Penicillium expansum TaxID=27334 RepID=A0A0A2KLN0_PENEN|nr:hypothetical protein PEX2_072130 [Penicillium expansum]KGO38851.1 hypothetical protein PEXP_097990 [Penicillium expansum]KGO54730.1 hypothetical protein PEX2_072130 [Penicillium expansum]KGO67878.1 hypothetical protein PEX1_064260 [Penicillium expansum]